MKRKEQKAQLLQLECVAKKGDTVSTYYWTPSVASRSCPRLALPTAAPQKLALTLIPTWMPTPALLQLGLSLLSNLRGHNLSTGVDRAAETPAPSTAHHDDAQAPAPAPHHAIKLVTMKTPYGRSCGRSYGWCRFGLRKELQTCHPLHAVLVPFMFATRAMTIRSQD